MDYPNDFDMKTFPAGKSIAWSRVVSIKISIIFFLILCACGLLLFLVRSKRNFPFLISTDPLTDKWVVVAYPKRGYEKSIEQYQIIQEKLVNDFITDWFTISPDQSENEARWKECDIEDCTLPERYNPQNIDCSLFCASSDTLFEQFKTKVLKDYTARINQAAETWVVEKRDIMPYSVTQNASSWQVYSQIRSSVSGVFNVLTFVYVEQDQENHPVTLGYYVKDFNSYRMAQ